MKTHQKKKRVLIVAYAYSPVLGSEYRQPWELCKKIAGDFEVTLLFGDSDGLMGSFSNFDHFVKADKLNYEVVKVHSSLLAKAFAKLTLRMPFSLLFPILLRIWHRKAYSVAKRLHEQKPFDVAHQLGPIGFRNPGFVWKLPCKTYWGPIGGAQYINTKMISRKWSGYGLEALVRNFSVRLQRYSPYIARAARNFDELSFATFENRNFFNRYFSRDGVIISDQGLNVSSYRVTGNKSVDRKIKVAWAGSLTPRKNVSALIEIIKGAPKDVEFHVMGAGAMEGDLVKLALTCQNLVYHGRLQRSEVHSTLQSCDIILLTSLSEANTAILFEGIESGCIPIAPKINGFVSVMNNEVGRLIEQTDFSEYVSKSVAALISLQDPKQRAATRHALTAHVANLSWHAMSKAHTKHYN